MDKVQPQKTLVGSLPISSRNRIDGLIGVEIEVYRPLAITVAEVEVQVPSPW